MTRRVLITGGLGYIGGRVAKHLARNSVGNELSVATRRIATPTPEWLVHGEIVHLDVLGENIPAVCRGIDSIVHLAAVNEIDSAESPSHALRVNAEGTLNVLSAAVKSGVKRFIYFSTAHVYGAPLSGRITEQTLPKPAHPYAITHHAAEDFVLAEQAAGRIEGIVIRLSNAFGVPERANVNRWTLLINDLCRQAVTSQSLTLKTSGFQQRDFVTLHDVARAVEHLIDVPSPLIKDGLFNLGGENSKTVYDTARLVQDRCPAILGFRPEINRPPVAAGEKPLPLDYEIQKLKATGFQLNGDVNLEIDDTLRLCQSAFSAARSDA
jgi:UDP-glucose 4-epimerase